MNSRFDPRLIDAAVRNDKMCFLWKVVSTVDPSAIFAANWHHEAILEAFEAAINGRHSRLVICAPPRSLKSIIASVAVPAWILAHDPTRKIICITYSSEMAAKLSNDFRLVVRSRWFRQAFPATVISDRKNTEVETVFTAGGFRLGTSIGGMLTGRGGDTIICDDPIKAQDAQSDARRETINQVLQNTILSRLDDKRTGSVVVVMQRLHANDFVGSLLSGDTTWQVLKLAAIAIEDEMIPIGGNRHYHRKVGEPLHAEREPLSLLEEIRSELGPDLFDAQYQQTPVPPGGLIIKKDWILYYDELPPGGYYIISWDTAGKDGPRNSFSVATVWYRKKDVHYLVDLVRGRFSYPTLCDTAVNLVKRYKPRVVLIEDASTGVALKADIRRDVSCKIELVPVIGDKIGRLYLQQGKFASGMVWFPKDKPFMDELLHELLRFPQLNFSDQVDSISQALAYVGSTYTLDNIY